MNYKKFQQIDLLFSQMNESLINSLEKALAGDTKVPINKKVFQNYCINKYFDDMIQNSTVREILRKI